MIQQLDDPYRLDAGLYDRLMGIYLDREQQLDEFIADGRLSAESQENLLEVAAHALSELKALPLGSLPHLVVREVQDFKKCIDDFDAILKTIVQSEDLIVASALSAIVFVDDNIDIEPAAEGGDGDGDD